MTLRRTIYGEINTLGKSWKRVKELWRNGVRGGTSQRRCVPYRSYRTAAEVAELDMCHYYATAGNAEA
jgi:hypothetical protein